MTPDAITLLFKEVRDSFPPIKGKPTDDDLLSIWETILRILMEIPFNLLGGSIPLWESSRTPRGTPPTVAGNPLSSPPVSPSTTAQLQMTQPRSFAFVRRRPTKLASTTTPATRRPNAAPPNSSGIPSGGMV